MSGTLYQGRLCKICGHPEGEHSADNMECPLYGEHVEWEEDTFESDEEELFFVMLQTKDPDDNIRPLMLSDCEMLCGEITDEIALFSCEEHADSAVSKAGISNDYIVYPYNVKK